MYYEIFQRIKEKVRELVSFQTFAFGDLLRRIPSPEELNTFLPAFVLEPTDIDFEFLSAQKDVLTERIRWQLHFLTRWTGKEEDLNERLELMNKLIPKILELENERLNNKKIRITSFSITRTFDLELIREAPQFSDLSGITLEFETKILKEVKYG
jgi:hypothetical protein